MSLLHRGHPLLAVGTWVGLAMGLSLHAQSADGLIDKLVEKGILTVKEANELREESKGGFASPPAGKHGLPEWVTSLKFSGDLRGRFDGLYGDNPGQLDRNRLRYRVRLGFTAVFQDDFEVGFRMTTAEQKGGFGGDPISGNVSFQENGSKKYLFLDLAYAKWTPVHSEHWRGGVTFGKMENPFTISDLVFDHDYTPEGIAAQLAYAIDERNSLKLNLGGFVLNEIGTSNDDPLLGGAQLRWDSTWTQALATSLGVSAWTLENPETLVNGAVPNLNRGNTRSPVPHPIYGAGPLAFDYQPWAIDASATYALKSFPFYPGAFPIRIDGEYLNNVAVDAQGEAFQVGLTFGKAGKRRTWEIGYKWKQLERDAWYEELVDSDYGAYYQAEFGAGDGFASTSNPGGAGYGAGTNLRGHVLKASYSPYDSLTLSATGALAELIDENPAGSESRVLRVLVDALWKF